MKQSPEEKSHLPVFTRRFREIQGQRSNTEFADFLGISRQTVGFYCNGDRLPDAVMLRMIAEKCQVSADWLLGLTDIQNVNPDIRSVCDYTGLTECTVASLNMSKNLEPVKSSFIARYFEDFIASTLSKIDDAILCIARASHAQKVSNFCETSHRNLQARAMAESLAEAINDTSNGMIKISAQEAYLFFLSNAQNLLCGSIKEILELMVQEHSANTPWKTLEED